MQKNWADDWTIEDALLWLALPSEIRKSKSLEENIGITISDLVKGVPFRLNCETILKAHKRNLKKSAKDILDFMNKNKILKSHSLPPIIWIRLMKNLNLKLDDAAEKQLVIWHEKQHENGRIFLYKYSLLSLNKYFGPNLELSDGQTANGFLYKQLFTGKRKKIPAWPYSVKWKILSKKIDPSKSLSTTNNLKKTKNTLDIKTKNKLTTKVPKARKRRSLQDIKRDCGTNLVEELQNYLHKEIKRSSSMLTKIDRNKRLYSCEHSLDKLVKHIQKNNAALGTCSRLTLRSAIPFFVACPRGRPGGIRNPIQAISKKNPR